MISWDVSLFGAAGGLALFFILMTIAFLALGIGLTVWWVVVLIEALKVPDAQWDAARQNRLLYLVLMIVLGVVGTLAYVLVARPELRRVGPPPAPAY
jgi:polyferredoxin